jgi:hypothetical protein
MSLKSFNMHNGEKKEMLSKKKVHVLNTLSSLYSTPQHNSAAVIMYCKGKAIPLQAWTVPEGTRRLRLPDSKTIST